MNKSLNILVDLYKDQKKQNEIPDIIKKGIIIKKVFDLDKIELQQDVNKQGRIIKKYCSIKYGDDYYKLNHSFEEIEKLITPIKVKGFFKK